VPGVLLAFSSRRRRFGFAKRPRLPKPAARRAETKAEACERRISGQAALRNARPLSALPPFYFPEIARLDLYTSSPLAKRTTGAIGAAPLAIAPSSRASVSELWASERPHARVTVALSLIFND